MNSPLPFIPCDAKASGMAPNRSPRHPLLAERGLSVDHVTVWRWVQRYAPELNRRLRPRLEPTNDSWRVDETYIRAKGKWVYWGEQRLVPEGAVHKGEL